MSDLSLQLQQAHSQLPVSSYFDEALFQREMAQIFQRGPRYVGHSFKRAQCGRLLRPAQEDGGRALVRTPAGVETHLQRLPPSPGRDAQGARLAQRQPAGQRWRQYRVARCTAGLTPTRASCWARPHFAQDPCLNLNNYKLQEWNGMLFEDNGRDIAADLAGLGPRFRAGFFPATYSTASNCTSATTTGKPFIEVYSGGLPRWPLPPGLGPLRDLRRP